MAFAEQLTSLTEEASRRVNERWEQQTKRAAMDFVHAFKRHCVRAASASLNSFSTKVVDAAQTASNYGVDACPIKDRAANAIGLKKKVQNELDNEFGKDWYGNSRASAKLYRRCSSEEEPMLSLHVRATWPRKSEAKTISLNQIARTVVSNKVLKRRRLALAGCNHIGGSKKGTLARSSALQLLMSCCRKRMPATLTRIEAPTAGSQQ